MNFDDEQIADEKSIANMKASYADANKMLKVRTLADEKVENKNVLSLGRIIKKADKFFSYLKEMVSDGLKDFVEEMRGVNFFELEKLKKEYKELEKLEGENPELVERPSSMMELNKVMAETEIDALKKMLLLYQNEKQEKLKEMLFEMMERRLDAFEKIFLY